MAYFKALEFTTLTKRAAEIFGVEANEIEPDPAFAGPAGWRNRKGEKIAGDAKPFEGPAQNARYGEQAPRAAIETGPGALARARAEAAEGPALRSLPNTSRSPRSEALRHGLIAAAIDTGTLAIDTETSGLNPLTADLIGLSLCVARAMPSTCRCCHVRQVEGDGTRTCSAPPSPAPRWSACPSSSTRRPCWRG